MGYLLQRKLASS